MQAPEIKSPLVARKYLGRRKSLHTIETSSLSTTSPTLTRRIAKQPRRASMTPAPPSEMLLHSHRQRSSSFGHNLHFKKDRSNCSSNASSMEEVNDLGSDVNKGSSEKLNNFQEKLTKLKKKYSDEEFVFDYSQGKITHRQRPQTAFGSTIRPSERQNQSSNNKKHALKNKSIVQTEPEQEPEKASLDLVTADDFINKCIIDSQTPRVKPAKKPQTSSIFGQILNEFIPHDTERETPDLVEIAPVRQRGRSNSLPVILPFKPESFDEHF